MRERGGHGEWKKDAREREREGEKRCVEDGEYSEEWEDGELDNTDGSWEAGVDEAYPGIIMQANPILGVPYRQEYSYKVAEDWGKVIELDITVETPYATFTNCIKTQDWNALEPDIIENKYYAPGIGLVKEEVVDEDEETYD